MPFTLLRGIGCLAPAVKGLTHSCGAAVLCSTSAFLPRRSSLPPWTWRMSGATGQRSHLETWR